MEDYPRNLTEFESRFASEEELPHSTDEGRSTERFLTRPRVLLAGSVSSQPSSLSYLVRPPARSRQPKSFAAAAFSQLAIALVSGAFFAAGRVLSRARATAAKRTLDRFRPAAYQVGRGRWRSSGLQC